jgi:PAS domain S-box-containing protein
MKCKKVKKISETNYESTSISMKGNDEISYLSKEIENMLARLSGTQTDLQKSEERYRGIIESQEEFIVRVNKEGECIFVNDAYCEKFGKKKEQLIGKKFKPQIHQDDKNKTETAFKQLNQPPNRVFFEQRAMMKDEWRWIAWEMYAIKDKKDKTIEIQQVGRDVTEHKNNEIALSDRAAELEKLNKFMVDRELKMAELKKEIETLKNKK